MAYLAQVNETHTIGSLAVQQKLIAWQADGVRSYGSGISAMPSMHVSIAMLTTLWAWSRSRLWGAVAAAFTAIIFLGSIHLAYHYAVDGLVSLLLTPVIWWGAGRFAKAWVSGSSEDRSVAPACLPAWRVGVGPGAHG
jgi:hypothetical protein